MSTVKVSDLFKEIPDWHVYYAYFYNYKILDELPDIFGRDGDLSHEYLHHIHLASTEQQEARWRATKLQRNRTNRSDDPENDTWLLYAYDDCRDEYLLLTIFGPNAHALARQQWGLYLRAIKSKIVDPWINGLEYPEVEDPE